MSDISDSEDVARPRSFYKRPRSSRACKICHDRKVRCDVIERNPCSNCVTFKVKCVIPQPKKRAAPVKRKAPQTNHADSEAFQDGKTEKDALTSLSQNEEELSIEGRRPSLSPSKNLVEKRTGRKDNEDTLLPPKVLGFEDSRKDSIVLPFTYTRDEMPDFIAPDLQKDFPVLSSLKLDLKKVLKKQFRLAMSKVYPGSSPSAAHWMRHYTDNFKFGKLPPRETAFTLDESDLNNLASLGCFTLPTEKLCRKFIDTYFQRIHPQIPVLNKSKFLREYKDLKNPPSILLLQSVLSAGSREVDTSDWTEHQIAYHENVSNIIFRRAKALYDAGIEADPIPLCQSLVIFSNSWCDTNWTSKNFFHWARICIFTSQAFGMHRNQDSNTSLTAEEKKRYKIIWWTLVSKDAMHSITLNRPSAVNPEDYDVDMPTTKELLDGKDDPEAVRNADYFVHYMRLCKLAVTVFRNQLTMEKLAKEGISFLPILKQTDILMSFWKENLPSSLELQHDGAGSSDILGAQLQIVYHTILLWLHRATIVRNTNIDKQNYESSEVSGFEGKVAPRIKGPATSYNGPQGDDEYYPSWGVTFKAAHVILMITKQLYATGAILHGNLMFWWSIYNAAIMMLYHLHNKDANVSKIAKGDILSTLVIFRSKRLAAKYPVCLICAHQINEIMNDKQKQISLVKSILEAANKQSSSNTAQSQHDKDKDTSIVEDISKATHNKKKQKIASNRVKEVEQQSIPSLTSTSGSPFLATVITPSSTPNTDLSAMNGPRFPANMTTNLPSQSLIPAPMPAEQSLQAPPQGLLPQQSSFIDHAHNIQSQLQNNTPLSQQQLFQQQQMQMQTQTQMQIQIQMQQQQFLEQLHQQQQHQQQKQKMQEPQIPSAQYQSPQSQYSFTQQQPVGNQQIAGPREPYYLDTMRSYNIYGVDGLNFSADALFTGALGPEQDMSYPTGMPNNNAAQNHTQRQSINVLTPVSNSSDVASNPPGSATSLANDAFVNGDMDEADIMTQINSNWMPSFDMTQYSDHSNGEVPVHTPNGSIEVSMAPMPNAVSARPENQGPTNSSFMGAVWK